MKYNEKDRFSIEEYAKTIENMTLRETVIDKYDLDAKNKGKLGQLIEQYFFGYDINSSKEPDFSKAGVELKVCPVKEIKRVKSSRLKIKQRGLTAKERISVTNINFDSIITEDWSTASVRKKLDLLLMFYMSNKAVNIDEQRFLLSSLWKPSQVDLEIIRNDWNLIKSKIDLGRAHELSEGDTMYLGAATKGSGGSKGVHQPNSSELARKRAFSLKRSYVDYILEELVNKKDTSELYTKKVVKSVERSFDDLLNSILDNSNLTVQNLLDEYDIKVNRESKQFLNSVTIKMLEKIYGEPVKSIKEFNKAGIEIKCVLLQTNDKAKEAMSFEQIQYQEIANEEWETSTMRDKFENKKHLWVVYRAKVKYKKQKELKTDEIVLVSAFYWNMPIADLDGGYFDLWEDTVGKIKSGNYNNFLKTKDNKIGHIRPKATKTNNSMMTIQGTEEKINSFWLNASYISSEISKRISKK
ncbi:MAG: Sau3AI family type II restriction endonuclease [Acidaminobacteraceae bacterium]